MRIVFVVLPKASFVLISKYFKPVSRSPDNNANNSSSLQLRIILCLLSPSESASSAAYSPPSGAAFHFLTKKRFVSIPSFEFIVFCPMHTLPHTALTIGHCHRAFFQSEAPSITCPHCILKEHLRHLLGHKFHRDSSCAKSLDNGSSLIHAWFEMHNASIKRNCWSKGNFLVHGWLLLRLGRIFLLQR